MLKFVDTTQEISAWRKDGIGVLSFGRQYATNKTPLDFQYVSVESISDFDIISVDHLGNDIETTALNTDLVSLNNGNHYCSGQVDYDTPLDSGIYYFKVNNKYESELFGIIRTDSIIYSGISVSNPVEGETATLNFTATLDSDLNSSHNVTFYFGFSCAITGQSFYEAAFSVDTFAKTFDIPSGVAGACQVRISDSLGGSVTYNFTITAAGFLELEGGGFLELEDGTNLQLEG